jgi:hypothetical protein
MSPAHKLPARMSLRRRARLAAICATALAAAGFLSACGKEHKPGEPLREGLSQPVNGLRYTVFLTRQLNLKNTEDTGYVPDMKEAAPGHGLFGVFLQACNTGKKTATAVGVDSFKIVDAQGDEFFPQTLAKRNPFAYRGGPVLPENCEPARGSLAQQGPTSGALLLFDLPLAATENRPLELRINGQPTEAIVTLDI